MHLKVVSSRDWVINVQVPCPSAANSFIFYFVVRFPRMHSSPWSVPDWPSGRWRDHRKLDLEIARVWAPNNRRAGLDFRHRGFFFRQNTEGSRVRVATVTFLLLSSATSPFNLVSCTHFGLPWFTSSTFFRGQK